MSATGRKEFERALPPRAIARAIRHGGFCKAHGKPGFRTRKKALRAAEHQRSVGISLDAYRCDVCGLFHVTSQVERSKHNRQKEAA